MIRFRGLRKRKADVDLGQTMAVVPHRPKLERRLTTLATLNAGVGIIVAAESACQNGDWGFGGYPAQFPPI